MKILTFTSLFPNRLQPNHAVFIKQRMAAVNRLCDADVRVVAPIPYYPNISIGSRWKHLSKIPKCEIIAQMPVFHPRYIVTPKIGMVLYGFSMFMGSYITIKKLFRKWKFDLIDAHYVYPDGLAAILLGKVFDRPVVLSARGTDINYYPKLTFVRPIIKNVIKNANGLISVCQSLADIMTSLDVKKRKVKVIPNGVDTAVFYKIKKSDAKKYLNIKSNEKVLLSVGALIQRKGFHLLLKALDVLKRKEKLFFKTFIIGEGEEKTNLTNQIKKYGIEESVTLVGSIPHKDLRLWYNAADIFFLGSSREGWPNVVNEALACGTPVIATNVDGIPDIINSPELGIITLRNIDHFASNIENGFNINWHYDYISEVGSERTWNIVAGDVFSFFTVIKNIYHDKKISQ